MKYNFNILLQCTKILSTLLFFLVNPALNFTAYPQDTNTRETLYQPGVIVIGDDINYPPYSFIDENGEPAGFNIEIAKAVGDAMGLEVIIKLDKWDETRRSLEEGKIDAIAGMFFSHERTKKYKFSSKHSVSTGDVFTSKKKNISGLEDLKGKQVVVQTGDIIAEFLAEINYNIEIIEVSTVREALTLVENGQYDYAGLLKLPGLYCLEEHKLKNIKPAGLKLLPRDYCMAVEKDNENLLYILNAGLHIIKATDQYTQIHEKWLGIYEDPTPSALWHRFKWIIIVFPSISLLFLTTSLILRVLVRKKTKELKTLNENLIISNEKIIEQNNLLAISQKELKTRLDKINEQSEIIRFKQNFLANMSHEIRTPLTGVLGMIDILEKTNLSDTQKDYLNTIKASGENLREIINQVLDYSKIEAGKVTISPNTFEFKSLPENTLLLYKNNVKKDVYLQSIIDPKIPAFIEADKSRLSQVLNNFVSNAAKFTSQGSITISSKLLSLDEKRNKVVVKIEVIDTGIGIAEDLQKKLFVPFSQVEAQDTRHYEGTGLGLSICRQLIDMMGGETGLISEEGKGSTFWFSFSAKIAQDLEKLTPETKEFSSGKPLRILLAEDKVVNQKVITLMLNSMGHEVVIVCNGQQALDSFEAGKFDLILMDIQMPVMDGITATQKLKRTFTDLPPIVGLSANAFEGDREKYMEQGMDDYLTKPVKENDFLNIIQKLV